MGAWFYWWHIELFWFTIQNLSGKLTQFFFILQQIHFKFAQVSSIDDTLFYNLAQEIMPLCLGTTQINIRAIHIAIQWDKVDSLFASHFCHTRCIHRISSNTCTYITVQVGIDVTTC